MMKNVILYIFSPLPSPINRIRYNGVGDYVFNSMSIVNLIFAHNLCLQNINATTAHIIHEDFLKS